jgi:hypothetical protein
MHIGADVSIQKLLLPLTLFALLTGVPGFGAAPAPAPAPPPEGNPNPGLLPTDATPLILSGPRQFLSQEMRYKALRWLPERMWFNVVSETNQRLDTNIFQTYAHHKGDYVFRQQPNISLGYDFWKNTSIYTNWFLVKDVFAGTQHALNVPVTQSLAWGLRHDKQIKRVSAQFDFQTRELWESPHLQQADLLPAINLTLPISPHVTTFGSALLQMRSRHYMQGATQELDPFFSGGMVVRRGTWTFQATSTVVLNYRDPPFRHSNPEQGNKSFISDIEINHPVARGFNGLVAFMRAEPVYNWGGKKLPGLSGFDFRFYSGLRLAISKPSYASNIESVRQQLRQMEK